MTRLSSFITLAAHGDTRNRSVLFIHPHCLPSTESSSFEREIREQLCIVPPTGPLTLVYCHGAIAEENSSSLYTVRSFRAAYEKVVPNSIRSRIEQIIALHVSFLTRSHIYMSSFQLQNGEYSKLQYCDLISDLEKVLGVDATLLPLQTVDFDYDEIMRCWVGRQSELPNGRQPVHPSPDPSKSLIDLSAISLSSIDESLHEPTPSHSGNSLEP